MAEEKHSTSDLDNWLEDLDDSDEFSGELDQGSIDALLGGEEIPDSQPEKREASGGDDDSAELDQSNIDALLGGMAESEAPRAVPVEAREEESLELDQSNIDALLGGMAESEAPPRAAAVEAREEESLELDQSNIDALLGGMGESASPEAAPEEQADSESLELDQANIDILLSGGSGQKQDVSGGEVDFSQDNIDALLAGGTEKPPGLGEGLDVDQDEIDQLFSGLDDEDDIEEPFEVEDIDLANVLESGDDFLEVGKAAASSSKTSSREATVAGFSGADLADEVEQEKPKRTWFPPANKAVTAGLSLCLVLVIGAAVYFFKPGKKAEQAIPVPVVEQAPQVVEQARNEVAQNNVPVASDSIWKMSEGGGEVALTLDAQDGDGDKMTYEVTIPPGHGRLSGEAPAYIYLPNKDFPGEDKLEFRVSDGKDTSNVAKVLITGPDLAKLAADKEKIKEDEQKKALAQSKPGVRAKNKTFETKSTADVTIDWGRIWREANHSPFSSKVHVDIDSSKLNGTLSKIEAGKSRYQPDPSFEGRDVLYYRFESGGLRSGRGKLTMRVKLGNFAPQVHIKELAKAYPVGETVCIDASATSDENREKLHFTWEQISGTPVQIKKMNEQGSIISFAMPASFYTVPDSGPALRVIAVDEYGKRAAKEVSVGTISRRKTALWRGERGGDGAESPLRGVPR
ncbi:MAG: Ig-like domain-containing protein [Deltaproteobacteria bacterium]|nr:Ig-like domain-containing protein [Deltaproteobacteria bacterium]